MTRFSDAARAPFYFAYGSNMNVAQMRARVPGVELVGTGTLKGHEFLFSGYSHTWGGAVANVRRARGKSVFGVVYLLPAFGLPKLDRFEGYPQSYQRKSADISLTDGGSVSAVLYYKRQTAAQAPPAPVYVKLILAALKRHGAN